MISLHNRKCVTDRQLNSLLMRTAFCRGGAQNDVNDVSRRPTADKEPEKLWARDCRQASIAHQAWLFLDFFRCVYLKVCNAVFQFSLEPTILYCLNSVLEVFVVFLFGRKVSGTLASDLASCEVVLRCCNQL